MKRFLISAAALVLCALPLMALNVPQDQNFSGAINFDKGCLWSIQGTKVTATASQLNTASTIGITNASLTLTRQGSPSVTNATVAGGVLSGVSIAVTNVTLQTTTLTYLTTGGTTSTAVVVTNAVVQTGTAAVSSPTITLQTATVNALTNVTITTQHP